MPDTTRIFDYANPRNRYPRPLISRWAVSLLANVAVLLLPWLIPFVLLALAAWIQAIVD